MDWIIATRAAIFLTSIILLALGPIALIKLNTFIRRYRVAHEALKARVSVLERNAGIKPEENR